MNLTYLLYEVILLPFLIFALWISKDRVLKDEPRFVEYIIAMVVIITIFGILAIKLGEWYFPHGVNLGFYLFDHPIELYIEAVITPLLIISFWEYIKRKR